jgi:Zn-dependent protease
MLERIPRRERIDLVIAWLAIAIAFTIAQLNLLGGGQVAPVTAIALFAVSLLTVGVGFVLHEMAHKFTAMHFGYWAEFRKNTQMLLIAVILALTGVVFAAPGVTEYYGDRISRRENGLIAAAGPTMSLVLALIFLGVFAVLPPFSVDNIPINLGLVGLQINAMIAAFNMLPISILDGRKVLAWNVAVFAVLIVAGFALTYLALTI